MSLAGEDIVINGRSVLTEATTFRGKVEEMSYDGEIFALACMREVITLSRHSSITGIAPDEGSNSSSSSRHTKSPASPRQRSAIDALESRLTSSMEISFRREISKAAYSPQTILAWYLAINALAYTAAPNFVLDVMEPLYSDEVERKLKIAAGQTEAVEDLVLFNAQLIQSRLKQTRLINFQRKHREATTSPTFAPCPAFDSDHLDRFFASGEYIKKDKILGSPFLASFRKSRSMILCFAGKFMVTQTPPSPDTFKCLRDFLTTTYREYIRWLTKLLYHPQFRTCVARQGRQGPHHWVAFFVGEISMLQGVLILGCRVATGTWQAFYEDQLEKSLVVLTEWVCELHTYHNEFLLWDIHEWLDQSFILSGLWSAHCQLGGIFLVNWTRRNVDRARKLLAPLEDASERLHEAQELAAVIQSTLYEVKVAKVERAKSTVAAALQDLEEKQSIASTVLESTMEQVM